MLNLYLQIVKSTRKSRFTRITCLKLVPKRIDLFPGWFWQQRSKVLDGTTFTLSLLLFSLSSIEKDDIAGFSFDEVVDEYHRECSKEVNRVFEVQCHLVRMLSDAFTASLLARSRWSDLMRGFLTRLLCLVRYNGLCTGGAARVACAVTIQDSARLLDGDKLAAAAATGRG